MKNKLELLIILIDWIIVVAFSITLVVTIKNIISDKATSAESTISEQTVQVQQEPVSTSETAEATIESAVDGPSIEDTVSTSETADSTINEQSEHVDETVESTDANSEVQMDEPGAVSIDLDSDPDIIDGFDDMEEGVPASDEAVSWALDLAEKNGTVLH